MANSCKLKPDKGEQFFNSLRQQYGYQTAWDLWSLSQSPTFNEGKSFTQDKEGFPSLSEFLKDEDVLDFIGVNVRMKGMENTFPKLADTRENYTKLVNQANTFNQNKDNKDFIAIVEYSENTPEQLEVHVQRRTIETEQQASDQYSTQVLNNKLATELASIGITIDHITDAEMQAGRVGVTDFTKASSLAKDCASIIRIADNKEGAHALGEEFSHLVIGAFHEDPLIQRALDAITNEDALKTILGDEYDNVLEFYNGNLDMVAEEALGHLLQNCLLAQVTGTRIDYLMGRIAKNLKSKFKGLDAEAIEQAILTAQGYMGQLATDIAERRKILTRDRIRQAERDVQFNALSDRIQANIEVLQNAKNVEIKRIKITPRMDNARQEELNSRIKELNSYLDNEVLDTRLGLYNYALWAVNDLKDIEAKLMKKTFLGAPSFSMLRVARSYIQSYASFIHDIDKVIMETKDDDEVPTYLQDFELEDGTQVSITDVIKDLKDLQSNLLVRYNTYVKKALYAFFQPFFGEGIVYTMGDKKGQKVNLESIIAEATKDITFTDLWLDSMADSSDLYLQIMDSIAKKANDNARTATMEKSLQIAHLRKYAEENGVTSFEWMFAHDSKGKKTGDYVTEYDKAKFDEARKEFLEDLDARYGPELTPEERKKKYEEMRIWNRENADPDDSTKPLGTDKWLSMEYQAIQNDPVKKHIYEEFMDMKWEADGQYPNHRVSPEKAIQRRRSHSNRMLDTIAHPSQLWQNMKEEFKETFLEAEDDINMYGTKTGMRNFDGTEYMSLPILYTARLKNPEELSTDIFADLLVYTHSSNIYNEMDKVIDGLEVARNFITDGERNIMETRSGLPVVEKLKHKGEKIENPIRKNESNIATRVNSWMESNVYQRYIKDEGSVKILFTNKRISKTKTAQWIMSASSMAQMGFNFLANMANVATGLNMQNIDAVAHEYFGAKSLWKADKFYFSHLWDHVANLNSRDRNDFLSLFQDFFNIQADYTANLKRNQKKNIFERLFGSELHYLADKCGNAWLYNRGAIAYCMDKQVLVPKRKQQTKKVQTLQEAENAVEQMILNSEDMELTDDEQQYINTQSGSLFSRVTQVISNFADTISEVWKTPSTNIGTGVDTLVRDFFDGAFEQTQKGKWRHIEAGSNLLSLYPNMDKQSIYEFLDQLNILKQSLDEKGLTVIPKGITARGQINVNDGSRVRSLNVAGTLDLLVHDQQGNFYIYDMKTHRGKIKNETKAHWSKQLSLYKRFLEQEYGITVKGLNIIPIKVSYPTPKGASDHNGEGTAEYTVEEGTNQLKLNGRKFRGASPQLEDIIPLQETKKIPIEYDNLGFNKNMAKVTDFGDYEQMSLFEALQVTNAFEDRDDIKKMSIPEGTLELDGSLVDKDYISRDIQDMQIHMFGAYNEEDSNQANQYIIGRMWMTYRKWIKPQFNRRFASAELDARTGKTREGYYRTFKNFAVQKALLLLGQDLDRSGYQIAAHWNELNEDEKTNIKRALTEISLFALCCLVAYGIPWPDKKKRPWAIKAIQYLANREVHELGNLVPSPIMAMELYKTWSSPFALYSTLQNTGNLIYSLALPSRWVDERESGPYKGMSSLEVDLLKSPLPGFREYNQLDRVFNRIDSAISYYTTGQRARQ